MPKKDAAPEQDPVYRLRLRDDVNAAQFNAGGVEVSLDADNPVFETTEVSYYLGARGLPFLEEVEG